MWALPQRWCRCPCPPATGMAPAMTVCSPGTPSVPGTGRSVWRSHLTLTGEHDYTLQFHNSHLQTHTHTAYTHTLRHSDLEYVHILSQPSSQQDATREFLKARSLLTI